MYNDNYILGSAVHITRIKSIGKHLFIPVQFRLFVVCQFRVFAFCHVFIIFSRFHIAIQESCTDTVLMIRLLQCRWSNARKTDRMVQFTYSSWYYNQIQLCDTLTTSCLTFNHNQSISWYFCLPKCKNRNKCNEYQSVWCRKIIL